MNDAFAEAGIRSKAEEHDVLSTVGATQEKNGKVNVMKSRPAILIGMLGVVVGSAIGAKPASVNLRGVTAGVTTRAELDKNERWGPCLSNAPQADGSLWLEYRFWVWKKVVAVVRDGRVQTIDAVPPDNVTAQKLADTYELGPLTVLPSLPPEALVGLPIAEGWQALSANDVAGVLVFVEQQGGRQLARLVRFYASAVKTKTARVASSRASRPQCVGDWQERAKATRQSPDHFREISDLLVKEVLALAHKQDLLLVWVLDSSKSVQPERQVIAQHIEDLYEAPGQDGQTAQKRIATAVVSFGKRTRFLLDSPTTDVRLIAAAIEKIRDDQTGVENVISAVLHIYLKFRRLQQAERRRFVLVLVTDEVGDDLSDFEDIMALAMKYSVTVFVCSTMAPFARERLLSEWRESPQSPAFRLPVKVSPCSRRWELLIHPLHKQVYPSGFGPFELACLAQLSGGKYFFLDESRQQPEYDPATLTRYRPEYCSDSKYRQRVARSTFRSSLMKVVQKGDLKLGTSGMRSRPDSIDRAVEFLDVSIQELRAVEAQRAAEPLARWQANFDLTLARLYQLRVCYDEYCQLLEQNPALKEDGRARQERFYPNDVLLPGPHLKSNEKLRQQMRQLYQRVTDEHPGSPWARVAQDEVDFPVSWRLVK